MKGHDPLVGTVVGGRYRVESVIGDGAMGRVYRALNDGEGEPVALKLIRRNLLMHAGIVQRFRREMAITARIEHPNVVAVRGFGETVQGQPWLAMELLDGEELSAVIGRDGPLPPARVARIGVQVADALAAAHATRFVHRDLKPENVRLCGPEGRLVKVFDFGIARVIGNFDELSDADTEGGFQTITRGNVALGSPAYMSPEQVACEAVGPASDLYALGALMYEALAGRPPYQVRTMREAVKAHAGGAAPPVQVVAEQEVPFWLGRILRGLLQREPEDRPASAEAVAAALRAALAGAVEG